MKRNLLTVTLGAIIAAVSTMPQAAAPQAKTSAPQTLAAPKAPVAPQALQAPQAPSTFEPMVAKYCVGCHNTRNPLPAAAPLALDKVNFTDPGADALTWERVVKKLGVGAMPPQGSPTPGAAELNKFRASLIASLDAAAARKNNPGEYVIHRLNH